MLTDVPWTYAFLFLAVYVVLDAVWILISRPHHVRMIEQVQQSPATFNWAAAAIYYTFVPLLLFALVKSYGWSLWSGVALGGAIALLMFLTFDLTNKAIFARYPTGYMVMDVLGGVTSITLALMGTLWWAKHKSNGQHAAPPT